MKHQDDGSRSKRCFTLALQEQPQAQDGATRQLQWQITLKDPYLSISIRFKSSISKPSIFERRTLAGEEEGG